MDEKPVREIAYGVPAIAAEISEPNHRKVYYGLEQGLIAGAFKHGARWALNVVRYRESVGLPPKKS